MSFGSIFNLIFENKGTCCKKEKKIKSGKSAHTSVLNSTSGFHWIMCVPLATWPYFPRMQNVDKGNKFGWLVHLQGYNMVADPSLF